MWRICWKSNRNNVFSPWIPIQMELNADLDPDLKHWGTGGVGVVDTFLQRNNNRPAVNNNYISIIILFIPLGAKSIYQEHNLSLLLLLGQQSIIGPGAGDLEGPLGRQWFLHITHAPERKVTVLPPSSLSDGSSTKENVLDPGWNRVLSVPEPVLYRAAPAPGFLNSTCLDTRAKKISSVSSIVSLRALKAKIGKFCSVSSQKHRVYSSATSFLSSFFRTNHAIPVRNQEDVLLHLSYSFPLFFKRVKNDGNRQNVADLTKSSTATLIPLVTLMNC